MQTKKGLKTGKPRARAKAPTQHTLVVFLSSYQPLTLYNLLNQVSASAIRAGIPLN